MKLFYIDHQILYPIKSDIFSIFDTLDRRKMNFHYFTTYTRSDVKYKKWDKTGVDIVN